MRKSFKFFLFLVLAAGAVYGYRYVKQTYFSGGSAPKKSAQVLMDSVGATDKQVIRSLFLVENRATGRHGTGLLLKSGVILTDAGIVAGARPGDLSVYASSGARLRLDGFEVDRGIGVAELRPTRPPDGGMDLGKGADAAPGQKVYTWGFPGSGLPPDPLFCEGVIAGFRTAGAPGGRAVTRLVLSGSFRMGNGGGPLFRSEDYKLIGFVVTRRAPVDPYVERALRALASAPPGPTVEMEDGRGRVRSVGVGPLATQVMGRLAQEQAGVDAEALPIATLNRSLDDER